SSKSARGRKSSYRVPQRRSSRACRNSSIAPESPCQAWRIFKIILLQEIDIMRTDSEIKRDVEDELKYDASVGSSDIGVSVKNGVVALTGFVHSYSQKLQAETDAKRVNGVLGVANDLEVRLASVDARPDPEIARDVIAQIKLELPYSHESL